MNERIISKLEEIIERVAFLTRKVEALEQAVAEGKAYGERNVR